MILVKIGGGNAINIQHIVQDLSTIDKPYIIVHGANAARDELAHKLQKPRKEITVCSANSSSYVRRGNGGVKSIVPSPQGNMSGWPVARIASTTHASVRSIIDR